MSVKMLEGVFLMIEGQFLARESLAPSVKFDIIGVIADFWSDASMARIEIGNEVTKLRNEGVASIDKWVDATISKHEVDRMLQKVRTMCSILNVEVSAMRSVAVSVLHHMREVAAMRHKLEDICGHRQAAERYFKLLNAALFDFDQNHDVIDAAYSQNDERYTIEGYTRLEANDLAGVLKSLTITVNKALKELESDGKESK